MEDKGPIVDRGSNRKMEFRASDDEAKHPIGRIMPQQLISRLSEWLHTLTEKQQVE